jgi:uncharacterized protein YqeY
MPLRDDINAALKTAMLGKDEATTGTLRLVNAKIKDGDIAARSKGVTDGLKDEELLPLFQTMIKQRRESIAMYEKGNRPELAKQEADEITVIERFLPKQMDEAAVRAAIDKIVTDTGAKDVKDMGKVMGELKKNFAGQMDFSLAGPLVKARLAG